MKTRTIKYCEFFCEAFRNVPHIKEMFVICEGTDLRKRLHKIIAEFDDVLIVIQ